MKNAPRETICGPTVLCVRTETGPSRSADQNIRNVISPGSRTVLDQNVGVPKSTKTRSVRNVISPGSKAVPSQNVGVPKSTKTRPDQNTGTRLHAT
jgi:hypothetical protein